MARYSDESESACGTYIFEVTEMVVDLDIVQGSAESPQGYTHPIRTTESTELTTTFDVWFQVQENTWDPATLELSLQPGNVLAKISQDSFMATVPDVGRYEMLESCFVDMTLSLDRFGMTVILDMHPSQPLFHLQVLEKNIVS